MISATANQLAVFTRLLLLGSAVGGAYALLTPIFSRSGRVALVAKDLLFGVISGVLTLIYYLNTQFVPFAFYIPLSFALGFSMGWYIFKEVIANIKNIVYNISQKKNADKGG